MSDDEVYEYLEQRFEWSRVKAATNLIRHGVRFPEAATVFFDENALFEPVPDHSEEESRYIVLGYSLHSKLLLVVHVSREERLRIISGRLATLVERERDDTRRREL